MTCCLAIAVSACGGGHAVSAQQQVSAVLHSYLRAQAAGDGQAACALLTASGQQQLIALVVKEAKGLLSTRPSCQDAVGLIRAVAGAKLLDALSGAQVEQVQIHGQQASAIVADGLEFPPQRVTLQKAGGAWKISGVPGIKA